MTEHHVGSGIRIVPLFAELKPHLKAAFDAAAPGSQLVITTYRDTNQNLRTQMERIIVRAGIKPWVKTFQNPSSTRATELCERFPSHVAAEWLGHSVEIANANHRQVTDAHFQLAASNPSSSALRNPVQQSSESPGNASQSVMPAIKETPVLPGIATRRDTARKRGLAEAGFEPDGVGVDVTSTADNRLRSDVVETVDRRAAESGAVSGDAELLRLIELWPKLSTNDRAALLAHAERLAANHDDATGETTSR